MSVRILLDGPRSSHMRRLARAVAVGIAVPLIAAGVIGWSGAVAETILIATSSSRASDLKQSMAPVVVFSAAALVGLPVGIRLLRGRRRVVLFLRKFGFADATRALSFAAAAVIGRSSRLVTLDDAEVKAVGGPAAPRRLAGLAYLATVAVGPFFAVWLYSSGMRLFYNHTTLASSSATTGFGDAILGAIGEAFAPVLIAIILGVFVASFVVSSALFSASAYGLARRAERAKGVRINSTRDVPRRSRSVMKHGSRIFAPRLLVVTVANEVWQQAVSVLARDSAAVIIDISIPSENLRWEISTLLPAMRQRCILVGRLDLLTESGPGGEMVFASPLARDIDGCEVLAYRTDGPGTRRFARALRATVESRASR